MPDFNFSHPNDDPASAGAATYNNIASAGAVASLSGAAEGGMVEGAKPDAGAGTSGEKKTESPPVESKKPPPPVKPRSKGSKRGSFFSKRMSKKKVAKVNSNSDPQYENITFDTKL